MVSHIVDKTSFLRNRTFQILEIEKKILKAVTYLHPSFFSFLQQQKNRLIKCLLSTSVKDVVEVNKEYIKRIKCIQSYGPTVKEGWNLVFAQVKVK